MRRTEHRTTTVRRREIIAEARHILAREGMDTLTIKALADATGITEGAIYRHFRSKQEILLGLIDEIEETLFETVEKAQALGGTPLERLERLLQERLSYAERRRGVTFVVMAEVLLNGDRELRRRMHAVIERYLEVVQRLLEEGAQMGEVAPDINRDAAALAFFGLVQATVTLWRFAEAELPLAERHKALWGVFRDGVSARRL